MTGIPARPGRGRLVALWGLGIALTALYAVLVPVHTALYGASVPVAFLLGAGICGAPALALRYPRSAIAVFTVASLLLPLSAAADRDGFWPWPWSVPALISFAVFVLMITTLHGWRRGVIALLLGVLASAMTLPWSDVSAPGALVADLIVTAGVTGAGLGVGVLLAGRIRLGAELERERENSALEQSRRELVEERTRIARELHDVVAHSMSLIQVQASTARFRAPGLPDEAVAEFESIAASARGALVEMRRILGVMRTADHTAELAPQHGIDDIPALVETTRRAGATVELTHHVDGDITTASQIGAYRIVQESLSNAVRHASSSRIAVTVTTNEDDIVVRVRNAPVAADAANSGGHGLRGMHERAALLGGSVHTGLDGDGWLVSARIPRHPVISGSEGSS